MHGFRRNEHVLKFDFRHYSKEHLKFNVIFHSPVFYVTVLASPACPYPSGILGRILKLDFKGRCVIIHAIILEDNRAT